MWPWHFLSASPPVALRRRTSRFRSKRNGARRFPLRRRLPPRSITSASTCRCKRSSSSALMLKDGSTAWSVECPMSAPPAAGGGLVYAGSDGLIEARSRRCRRAQWRRPVHRTCPLAPLGRRLAVCADRAGPVPGDSRNRRRNPLAEGFWIAAEHVAGADRRPPLSGDSKTAGSSRCRCRTATTSGRKSSPSRPQASSRSAIASSSARATNYFTRSMRRMATPSGDGRPAPTCSACRCSTEGVSTSSRSTTSCAGTTATTGRCHGSSYCPSVRLRDRW